MKEKHFEQLALQLIRGAEIDNYKTMFVQSTWVNLVMKFGSSIIGAPKTEDAIIRYYNHIQSILLLNIRNITHMSTRDINLKDIGIILDDNVVVKDIEKMNMQFQSFIKNDMVPAIISLQRYTCQKDVVFGIEGTIIAIEADDEIIFLEYVESSNISPSYSVGVLLND